MTNTQCNFFDWLRDNYDGLLGKPANLSKFDNRFFNEFVASKSEIDRSQADIDFGKILVADCSECRKLSLVSSKRCPGCGNPLSTASVSDHIENIERDAAVIFPKSDLVLQSLSQTESEEDDEESSDSSSESKTWQIIQPELLGCDIAVAIFLIAFFIFMMSEC